ncbi:MAG: hypothetical protein KGD60_09800 [Candidatus Thorarchaeota archaeon]|nr:hypothetical protein [Candidatus Thorarchaeota archaeon]
MSESNNRSPRPDDGMEGMGRWIAVASELPCAVIALLLVGQVVGGSIAGPSGAMWGALLGALLGFVFGVYSVFVTIRYFDELDAKAKRATRYMPPMEEILEDVTFDLDSTSSDEPNGE